MSEKELLADDSFIEFMEKAVFFVRERFVSIMLVLVFIVGGVVLFVLRNKSNIEEEQIVAALYNEAIRSFESNPIDAQNRFREILKDHSGSSVEPWVLLKLGDLYFQRAQITDNEESNSLYEEARQYFEPVVNLYPNHIAASIALYSLAKIAEEYGNGTEAFSYYTRLIEQYPDSPYASYVNNTILRTDPENKTTRFHAFMKMWKDEMAKQKLAQEEVDPASVTPDRPDNIGIAPADTSSDSDDDQSNVSGNTIDGNTSTDTESSE